MSTKYLCQMCSHWHNVCQKYRNPGIDCIVGLGAGKFVLIDEDSDNSYFILWHPIQSINHLIMRSVEYESTQRTNEFSQ